MAETIVSNGRTFKRVGNAAASNEKPLRFIRPSDLSDEGTTGVILEGAYIGPVANNLEPSKSDYKFETDSEIIILNGSGSLTYRMKDVTPGSLVQVVYNGKQKIKKGKMAGRDAHSFDVLVAID